ncbi:MAG TPA: hypothetical protein IAC14_11720 [Candidatus Scybalomonas excrementigallinarum]|nr:hypothetical protein [Candidatus Scybalomonas excrementigallinarum]
MESKNGMSIIPLYCLIAIRCLKEVIGKEDEKLRKKIRERERLHLCRR